MPISYFSFFEDPLFLTAFIYTENSGNYKTQAKCHIRLVIFRTPYSNHKYLVPKYHFKFSAFHNRTELD